MSVSPQQEPDRGHQERDEYRATEAQTILGRARQVRGGEWRWVLRGGESLGGRVVEGDCWFAQVLRSVLGVGYARGIAILSQTRQGQ